MFFLFVVVVFLFVFFFFFVLFFFCFFFFFGGGGGSVFGSCFLIQYFAPFSLNQEERAGCMTVIINDMIISKEAVQAIFSVTVLFYTKRKFRPQFTWSIQVNVKMNNSLSPF